MRFLLPFLFAVELLNGQATESQPGIEATENERLGKFTNSSEYIIDLMKSLKKQTGSGGSLSALNSVSLPSIAGHLISMNLIELAPCGINLPHLHPRATEALYGVKANQVTVGFIPENFGKVTINKLSTGQATFFPQGYIHFEFNNNCKPAVLLAALNHDDPGTLTINSNFWKLDTSSLAASLGLKEKNAEKIKNHINLGLFPRSAKLCRKRCNLPDPKNDLDMEGNTPSVIAGTAIAGTPRPTPTTTNTRSVTTTSAVPIAPLATTATLVKAVGSCKSTQDCQVGFCCSVFGYCGQGLLYCGLSSPASSSSASSTSTSSSSASTSSASTTSSSSSTTNAASVSTKTTTDSASVPLATQASNPIVKNKAGRCQSNSDCGAGMCCSKFYYCGSGAGFC